MEVCLFSGRLRKNEIHTQLSQFFQMSTTIVGVGGGIGSIFAGICHWLLRTPTPSWSKLWSTIDPILVTIEQN